MDDGTDETSRRGGRPCPMCDTAMFRRHCKYVCPNHGVVVDCSDPFTF
ncbi:HVO_2523 family zinc finger protein [Salinirubellus sp. GCM10025818]